MPQREFFLTPNTLLGVRVPRTLLIPPDVYFLAAVNGALLSLTNPDNWEFYGSISPELAAEAAFLMLSDFWS